MNAKLGSDGRLTLSGWFLNQLDSPDFAWRTKNSLLGKLNIREPELNVKKSDQNLLFFPKSSCMKPTIKLGKTLSGWIDTVNKNLKSVGYHQRHIRTLSESFNRSTPLF
jgi:hypothetical protein